MFVYIFQPPFLLHQPCGMILVNRHPTRVIQKSTSECEAYALIYRSMSYLVYIYLFLHFTISLGITYVNINNKRTAAWLSKLITYKGGGERSHNLTLRYYFVQKTIILRGTFCLFIYAKNKTTRSAHYGSLVYSHGEFSRVSSAL